MTPAERALTDQEGPGENPPQQARGESYAELRRLLADATPGPWEARQITEAGHWGVQEWTEIHSPSGEIDIDETPDGKTFPNAALIVAAVNALPGLLDENEKLRVDRDLHYAASQLARKAYDALKAEVGRYEAAWQRIFCPRCQADDQQDYERCPGCGAESNS